MYLLIQDYEAIPMHLRERRKECLRQNKVSKDTMKGWRKPKRRKQIEMDASRSSTSSIRRNAKHLLNMKRAKLEKEEEALYEEYKARRAQGLVV